MNNFIQNYLQFGICSLLGWLGLGRASVGGVTANTESGSMDQLRSRPTERDGELTVLFSWPQLDGGNVGGGNMIVTLGSSWK